MIQEAQTPPPTASPPPTPFPGEDCRTNGAWWYCAMPDPNPARHFDTRDCYSAGSSTYCSINMPYVYNDGAEIQGFPAIYVVGFIVLAVCVLAYVFRKRPARTSTKK